MPLLYTVESPEKSRPRREDGDAREEPRRGSGFFRGVLFALPGALLLWALFLLAVRALLHHH